MTSMSRKWALVAGMGLALASVVHVQPASAQVYIGVAPPPPRHEFRPPPPRPGYEWAPGYWQWNPGWHRHVWVPGHWMAGRPGYHWHGGYWGQGPHGWRWRDGYWGR